MKKLVLLFLPAVCAVSCCILPRSYAQSDRFDTHKTPFECIPCKGLTNKPEHFVWVEGYGTSGNASVGMELGYNFNHLRLYGSGGFSWWPSPVRKTTVNGEFGIVGLSPDKYIRPEAGIGLGEWFINEEDHPGKLHPAHGFPIAEKGQYPFWNAYAGMRMAIPYSNISLSLRMYRLNAFGTVNHSAFAPGLVCGFRF